VVYWNLHEMCASVGPLFPSKFPPPVNLLSRTKFSKHGVMKGHNFKLSPIGGGRGARRRTPNWVIVWGVFNELRNYLREQHEIHLIKTSFCLKSNYDFICAKAQNPAPEYRKLVFPSDRQNQIPKFMHFSIIKIYFSKSWICKLFIKKV
jgi:hypothetical protein